MCPFSILTRCWMILVFLLLICQYVVSQCNITCDPSSPTVYVDETVSVLCNVTGIDKDNEYVLQVQSDDTGLLKADQEIWLATEPYASAALNMTGIFLGRTKAFLKLNKASEMVCNETLSVTVIRKKRPIDTVFTASVATLVALIYVNFGCALDWQQFKLGLKRPIGPILGFISQFLFMPLLSFGLGKLLFPDNTDMQLGMFFTGVAPAGGASNMWAVILGGNLHLSITMTTISNLAAFAMMPLWLFTLGRQIFSQSEIPVPYSQILMYASALVVPLFIGYLMQRYLKRTARFMAKILKGFSSLLLIFIVIFAIVTNLYLFELFSWQIVVSGLGLPWLGYMLGWIFAKIFKQSSKDALTIAIEAGIQNTGISIFLLRLVLPQPEADLTTVAPVAVATMTPIPLLAIFIYQKIRQRCKGGPTEGTILDEEKEQDVENIDAPVEYKEKT